jgi:hypothetical protein
LANMQADQSQELLIRHAIQRKGSALLLTPLKHSINDLQRDTFFLHLPRGELKHLSTTIGDTYG